LLVQEEKVQPEIREQRVYLVPPVKPVQLAQLVKPDQLVLQALLDQQVDLGQTGRADQRVVPVVLARLAQRVEQVS
jgi:hypothetical protein